LFVAAAFVVPSAVIALQRDVDRPPREQMTELFVNRIETVIATYVDRLSRDNYSIQIKDITPPAAVTIEIFGPAGVEATHIAPDQLHLLFGHCAETERWSEQGSSDGTGAITAHAALECTNSNGAKNNIYIGVVAAATGMTIAEAKITRGGPPQGATVPVPYTGPPPQRP
jgi:hypothetical protein